MYRTIHWTTVKINLNEWKILAEPMINFIENWLEKGYTEWHYKPYQDDIGTWKVTKNYIEEVLVFYLAMVC
jgi:hypothetical protein